MARRIGGQRVQRDGQQGAARRGGRGGEDDPVAVGDRQRVVRDRRVLGEIAKGERTALLLHELDARASEIAVAQRRGAVAAQTADRVGQAGGEVAISGAEESAIRHPECAHPLGAAQDRLEDLGDVRLDAVELDALLGQSRAGLSEIGEGESSPAARGLFDHGGNAEPGDARSADVEHLARIAEVAVGGDELGRGLAPAEAGRRAEPIEHGGLHVAPGDEQVPAARGPREERLAGPGGEHAGDRGIDGVATGPQDVGGDARNGRVPSRGDAASCGSLAHRAHRCGGQGTRPGYRVRDPATGSPVHRSRKGPGLRASTRSVLTRHHRFGKVRATGPERLHSAQCVPPCRCVPNSERLRMFGPRSSGRARLLRAGLLSAAALVAAGPASAATVTKAWSGTCSVGPAGQTKLSLPANFAFTATLPDTVRPGGSFGATNPSYTITFPGTAVKSLAAAGSGVTADVRSLWLVSNSNPSQITPDGYNMAQGGVRSARQAFQTDRLDLFDGTKTTYKGLSLAVTPPSSTTALLASGTFKTEMAIATDVFGDLLIDQLFGQVKWELYCRQLGTGAASSCSRCASPTRRRCSRRSARTRARPRAATW